MKLTGACYCGEVRYEAEGEARLRGECHCRECQYITGGAENLFLMMPSAGFRYMQGQPTQFSRKDLASPVTREFCPTCGTHLVTRIPQDPSVIILKVGSLDEPAVFQGAQMVIFTCDAQAFHQFPEGVPRFERLPG